MNRTEEWLTARTRATPNALALQIGDTQYCYAELDQIVSGYCAALHQQGVVAQDHVAVLLPNRLPYVALIHALGRLGAVLVPLNTRLTAGEIAWQLAQSDAQLLIYSDEFTEVVGQLTNDNGCRYLQLEQVIESTTKETGFLSKTRFQLDVPQAIVFTSGTTGRPKAAVLTHGQMGFVVTNHLCDLMPGTGADWGTSDASLVVAPLSHGAGIHQLAQVAHGVPSVLPRGAKLDPAEVWHLVEKHRISNMFTVPTIVKLLIEHPAVDQHDHSSLRYVIYAGAPMYRADQINALEKLGPVLVQYFGLGEVTGNITVLPAVHHSTGEMKLGTCGFARTGMQVMVQRADGSACAPHETGEICATGPAVFAGYFNNPDANAKSFRDGWFCTGDLGHMDEQGFVYLTGRASDMYISGGSNIYPREIEEKILLHPAVSEAAVLGVPNRKWGEVGMAVCVCTAPVDPADLLAWLGDKLARYKMPQHVVFWDEMPKSAYGKITKKMIREELARRNEIPPE